MCEKDQVITSGTESETTPGAAPIETSALELPTTSDTEQSEKGKNIFVRIKGWFLSLICKIKPKGKTKPKGNEETEGNEKAEEKTEVEEVKTDEKTYNFQKLTPVQDASIDTYAAALDFVFKNDDVRNIAITGTYGSGKSSVIETYEKQHSERKFIHLSLAHFDQEDLQNSDSKTDNKDIRTIEGQLINQLLNQIPKENIPETQFGIKRDIDKTKYAHIALAACLCLFLVFFNLNYAGLRNFVMKIKDGWTKSFLQAFFHPGFRFIALLAFLGLVGYGIYKTVYLLTVKKIIRKVSVKGNEIELLGDSENSFFDKYLNEVLYLFEHSEADGIIFEDIDRYNNTLVFERLREINTLLWKRQKLNVDEPQRTMRFFYLVRDDLFENNVNKDRTKFFDFVIPVVPVVDGSNSYDKFYELFSEQKQEIWEEFNKRFLRRVCVFIDDFRMLKNIYNEFLIYRVKLMKNEIDCNKLFAMIVYKNIFPRDFAELQFQRGFVHALFASKADIVKAYNARLYEEISKVEMDMNRNDADANKEIKEIDRLSDANLTNEDNNKKLQMYDEYIRMKDDIRKRTESLNEPLKKRIQEKKKRILPNRHYCMRELIAIDGIEDYVQEGQETFQHVKNSPYYRLLTYLLRDSYIDETYPDYMGIFYPDSLLTINDKQFIRNVVERNKSGALGYDYHLNEPATVMDCLEEYDFTHSAVLNHDLFDYMLSNETSREMEKLIQVIIKTKDYQFIEEYLHSQRNTDKMIEIVTSKGSDMYWLYKSNMQPEMLRCFMYEALKADSFEKNGSEVYNDLKDYVSHQLEYIDKQLFQKLSTESEESAGNELVKQDEPMFTADDIEKIRKGISDLGARFVEVSDTISKDCLDYIYKRNLYEISPPNIHLIVEKYCGKKCDNDFLSKFMSFIIGQNELFCKYMSQELDHVMTIYLSMYDEKISDPSDTIIKIMNDEKIIPSDKEEYVKRLVYKVGELKQVEFMSCKKLLLQNKAVTYTGDNMLCYYGEVGYLDEILIDFVKSDTNDIHFSRRIQSAFITQFMSDLKSNNIFKKAVYEEEEN